MHVALKEKRAKGFKKTGKKSARIYVTAKRERKECRVPGQSNLGVKTWRPGGRVLKVKPEDL